MQEPSDDHKAAVVRRILLGEMAAEQACADEGISDAELTQWIRQHRRAARRAIDEQITAALSAHGLEKDDFVLSGNLESMALSDLLEAIQLGRKNAHIRIDHGREQGHLWCADGDVIDAQSGALVGAPAVYHLLSLRQGRLHAEFSSVLRERTVVAPTDALLLEFARRLDEARVLRERLGDTTRICLPKAGAAAAANLAPDEREVLSAFDGTRSIAAAIEASPRPELETLEIVRRLLDRGLLLVASVLPLPDAASSDGMGAAAPLPSRPSELSVPPIVPSLFSKLPLPPAALRYGRFAVPALALPLAFVAGYLSVRPLAAPLLPAPEASVPIARLASALCGPGMVFVPAGATPATATSPPDAPRRPFCLAERVVSTEEYQACVNGQHCTPTLLEDQAQPAASQELQTCNAGVPGRELQPINCVTPQQAEQYCEWRGQRLPLPEEWEFAAEWSREVPSGHPGSERTSPGQRAPSSFGDLLEWTKGRTARPVPGADAPAEGPAYAVLGGATSGASPGAHSSRRYLSASAHGRNLGFRCASSLEASAALPEAESVPAP